MLLPCRHGSGRHATACTSTRLCSSRYVCLSCALLTESLLARVTEVTRLVVLSLSRAATCRLDSTYVGPCAICSCNWLTARLLLKYTILSSKFRIFLLGQSQTKSDRKVLTQAHLGHFLPLKLLYSLWGLSRSEIPMAKLPDIIATPSIARSRPTNNTGKTCSRDLKVLNIQHLCTLNPMWRVKLSKCALTPDIKLPIGTQRCRERPSSHLDHTTER